MSKKSVSIIIPAYNEEGNIDLLVRRIEAAFANTALTYSIVFIDDLSTDKTVERINALAKNHPISLLSKEKNRGKAESLLMGFAHADADIIAMIDADLQYPPEAIPEMVEKILNGADIVVSHRQERKSSVFRTAASRTFRFVFGRFLFGLPYDIQSGLKVFRRSVIEHIPPEGKGWMFDLEFLVKASIAKYKIVSHPIVFERRHSGKAKIHVVRAGVTMAKEAVALKLNGKPVIPFLKDGKKEYKGAFTHGEKKFISHTDLSLSESAFRRMMPGQVLGMLGVALLLLGFFILNFHASVVFLIALLTILYFLDGVFQSFLVSRSFLTVREISVKDEELEARENKDYPMYTIFCPLYKEWRVIPQFIRAMSQLDYPKNKLQVLLLLEEDDVESITHVKNTDLPSFISVLVVPDSQPKTKPKALNYGLMYTKGEYAVIYDAEDIPDPKQLKKAVLGFERVSKDTICLQAKLNFYNPHQNLLTKLFTTEYSLWFDLILPGLQSIGAPIPLGGTSNHFRVNELRTLKGWDAFNVTEDCDLGMRLAKKRYKTAVIDSTTMEEANSQVLNWYGQRSRWIKGYIQTYLVHVRQLFEFSWSKKQPDGPLFLLIVGGKILSLFINPLMWIITISYFAFRPVIGPTIESFYPAPVLFLGVLSLVFGNFLYIYAYMIGCVKRGYYEFIKYSLITPFYWLGMSMAAWRALFEMIYKPFYWRKTVHGLHLSKDKKKKTTQKKDRHFEHVLGEYSHITTISRPTQLPSYCDVLQES